MLSKVWTPEQYREMDSGIRFAVKVLHARGIDTAQSCEGGQGHAYDRPTVDLPAAAGDALGFAALAALVDYGLPVRDVALVWSVDAHGLPGERFWRVTFREKMQSRSGDDPMFVWSYRVASQA